MWTDWRSPSNEACLSLWSIQFSCWLTSQENVASLISNQQGMYQKLITLEMITSESGHRTESRQTDNGQKIRTEIGITFYFLTLIRESWKKIQNAGPSPSAFSGKKSITQRCIICICSHALDFFPDFALGDGLKMAYIFIRHGIFPHISAYAISNSHHKIAQWHPIWTYNFYTLKSKLWRHQRWFWIFSKKSARW